MSFDPRTTLVRGPLADARLEGLIAAPRFAPTRTRQALAPSTALRASPDGAAEQVDQLLFGELFEALETEGEFIFGQAARDGYVGYVQACDLAQEGLEATHWVIAPRTFAFAGPSIKSPWRGPLSLNAQVSIEAEEETLARAARIGWIARRHLAPIGVTLSDPATVAEAHLGSPYLWGGRDGLGLDCSGLVQQALYACGRACPRDADQQALLGQPAPPEALERGDLVFWRGHVGMMLDAERLIHANGHHMAVAIEPLAEACGRIAGAGGGDPTAFRRLQPR